MSPDQYWNEDCELVKYYRQAYKLKREERNHEFWLQGMYFYHALCDASPLFRFSQKAEKAIPYPSEPFALTTEELKQRELRDEKSRFEKMKAKMEGLSAKKAR